MCQI